jgi:filamentous hemagglutinin family protein
LYSNGQILVAKAGKLVAQSFLMIKSSYFRRRLLEMKGCYLEKWFKASSVLIALFSSDLSVAQVVGDTTLPTEERSQVTGNPNFQIDGGARRDGNLFHSFQSFSVPTGGSAFFNNAVDVQNIFSRVTGRSISNIDGVIRANGTANLFLLNPNGILFGAGARLNIGGSFVASTANSINFADNFQYSATNPQTTPLLTVSVPVGLQIGTNPGSIVVQGNGYDLSIQVPIFSPLSRGTSSTGLQVPAGHTLALIGGDIELIGGTLTAEQGRLELGSVRDGQVSLDGGFALSYPGVQTFGDIRLSQQALADASGGGLIQVQGNQVSLMDGSLLLIQNQGTQVGGSIRVNAAQSLELSGTSSDGRIPSGLDSQTVGIESGADVAVSTRQLAIRDGATIVARSYSPARSGNVTTQASDSVQVIGVSSINPSVVSAIATAAFTSGDAGDVTVSTQELTLLNGGTIGSTTFGSGRGGDVIVNALDSIKLTGQSILFSQSTLQANSLGTGDAGQLTVNTSRLVIQDGGAVTTSTIGSGSAGSLTINASESIELSGRPPVPSLPSYVGSSAPIASDILIQAFRLPKAPSGASGDVTINTERLSITDGATVEVSNQGVGNGGTLSINANSIFLDTRGSITAATASGEGGNIDLNVQDVLLLRNNSPITTSAGGTGNGGNIYIKAGSILAFDDSDILAYAENGRGGDITLDTRAFFGENYRRAPRRIDPATLDNNNRVDVNATGAVEGVITLPDTTFIQNSLTELPENRINTDSLLVNSCIVRRNRSSQGSFTVTGTGGLQERPGDAQMSDFPTVDIETLPSEGTSSNTNPNRPWLPGDPIVEPQGVYRLPNGKLVMSRECP